MTRCRCSFCAFCNFFLYVSAFNGRVNELLLSPMTPFQGTILRAVSADRTSLFLSSPLFFSVDLSVFARRKRSARSASIGAFRYEGVTRYIGTEGDVPSFFLFLFSCLFFAPNSRTQEAAMSGETELQTDDFNRLFLNDIALLVTSTVELFLSLSCVTRIKEKGGE